MPGYHVWTIGCQMNQAESERLGSHLTCRGYQETSDLASADLVILNSCVVRQSAEARVLNKLDALKEIKRLKPELVLALTGCLVDSNLAELKQRFPHVDHFFRAGENPPWLDDDDSWPVAPARPAVTAYVPIIAGCNNFCTYCIVPYRRGREKSRPLVEITDEVRALVRGGAKEVILLGQNVDSYGNDLESGPDLSDLLSELNNIEGLKRIRFLTNHPKDLNHRLIEAVAGLGKVCRQICLPVQAGSDQVLNNMRRGYTLAHYRELVSRIRRGIPGVALSTDVIVGFPGETPAQFQQTLALLSELKFDTVHLAAYSPRPGTISWRELEDDVPPEEKQARLAEAEALQTLIATEINAALGGEEVEVLVTGRKKGKWYGRTRSDKLVFFRDSGSYLGELVIVKVEKTSPWSLQGRMETAIDREQEEEYEKV
ncbi:MAG: MiaB/RimO family radical SAM methylthiotransferase [Dehalococcoidales bacterium]|jgi:tRNA-2-methylthio-N6-dimethylallyladenosine synthase